ncbi:AEC family transporter [Anabaena sp. FACHB-1237]|uniref:AEC family transporter n=1 Tax=Anabaena sp. FACHB-1237 TaxID=2692769 RepID=UPI00168116EE|nr:AEC family transporter [Anabaena sp. FACHB-1237]MBD2136909.1 AEC family transporter [Anabaena sp. FACHB-1237]
MTNIIELYIKLIGLVSLGFILGRKLPSNTATYIGRFLFWIGVPITIIAFLRKTDLSGQIWIAPAIAYFAMFIGILLAWLAMKTYSYCRKTTSPVKTQGSVILAAMVGNTGYLGFPVTLAMVGKDYFAWALFYDLLGSLFIAYGVGTVLAAKFGNNIHNYLQILQVIFINPALWSFGFGVLFRQVTLSQPLEFALDKIAWAILALSLILIGVRMSRLTSWGNIPQASISVVIKMLLVPVIVGILLSCLGVTGKPALVIILQTGMPPAFATLVLAETFNLDHDLAVTTLAMGVIVLLFTLPLWLWLW